ncbi:hypothetical protein P171DRAFT_424172 [Karstenula rhodostoma CBS 690.94]|uniref:Uncharacterized protein n=1 Tax=Karstenula rhodostoma CBS 690.94 TaxID=1392251 RepID=A0A9P4U5K3_9PLEO|nr:hypothetical protein P171DRAFT_424172 [Karstenula rhodostoma CBS 690.94]
MVDSTSPDHRPGDASGPDRVFGRIDLYTICTRSRIPVFCSCEIVSTMATMLDKRRLKACIPCAKLKIRCEFAPLHQKCNR